MRILLAGAGGAIGRPLTQVLPGRLIRMAAPYVAAMVLDTSTIAANAAARRDLRWAPRFAAYRDGLRVLRQPRGEP